MNRSRSRRCIVTLVGLCAAYFVGAGWLGTSTVHAEVITDWVQIGNAGNTDDPIVPNPVNRKGGVNYEYRISKYEVTNAQYADFLNHKATTGGGSVDGLQLYNQGMSIDPYSGGIQRSGAGTVSDPWVYTPNTGRTNFPVGYIDMVDALRYTNWLNNGQGDSDVNDGAYTLPSDILLLSPSSGYVLTRNADAKVWLPSWDEWYKAAYYDPSKPGGAGYWLYATGTDTAPGSVLPDTGNNANYRTGPPIPTSTTPVGAFDNSPSPYGTFDQAGNVFEWIEQSPMYIGGGVYNGWMLGGYIATLASGLHSNTAVTQHQYNDGYQLQGFRVAAVVPEPSSFVLAALGAGAVALIARRRRPLSTRNAN